MRSWRLTYDNDYLDIMSIYPSRLVDLVAKWTRSGRHILWERQGHQRRIPPALLLDVIDRCKNWHDIRGRRPEVVIPPDATVIEWSACLNAQNS